MLGAVRGGGRALSSSSIWALKPEGLNSSPWCAEGEAGTRALSSLIQQAWPVGWGGGRYKCLKIKR